MPAEAAGRAVVGTRTAAPSGDAGGTGSVGDTAAESGSLPGERGYVLAGPGDNKALLTAAKAAMLTFPHAYGVGAHTRRTPDGRLVALADGTEYAPVPFASRVRQLPGYVPGTPVVLVMCRAGAVLAGGRAFAVVFAPALGADALAADLDVWQTGAKVLSTETVTDVVTRVPRPRLNRDGTGTGHWILFPARPVPRPAPGAARDHRVPTDEQYLTLDARGLGPGHVDYGRDCLYLALRELAPGRVAAPVP